jgi:hypothetical protein
MFWDRQSRAERIASMREIQDSLRRHHRNPSGPEVHPRESFKVPEWSGIGAFSGVSIHGAVPTWDL